MSNLLLDLRYALRTLIKNPLTTGGLVLALALGIGANTVMFSMLNALLFRALPFPDLDRTVSLAEHHPHRGSDRNDVSPGNFLEWRRQARSFEQLTALRWWEVNLAGGNQPEWTPGAMVSAPFFATLGVSPALGRAFRPDEERLESDRVGILSHGLWQRRFGADPAVLGRVVQLSGEPYTVVGVAPASFNFPPGVGIWAPLRLTPKDAQNFDGRSMRVVGRLKPGVSLERARVEMREIAKRLEREHPDDAGWSVLVHPVLEDTARFYLPGLTILVIAVVLVLLIACANAASLMLAQASTRLREISIRTALGASRWRIV